MGPGAKGHARFYGDDFAPAKQARLEPRRRNPEIPAHPPRLDKSFPGFLPIFLFDDFPCDFAWTAAWREPSQRADVALYIAPQ